MATKQTLDFTGTTLIPLHWVNLFGTLTPIEFVMLVFLLFCEQNGYTKASRNFLRTHLRLSLSAVTRGVRKLESLGFINKAVLKAETGAFLPTSITIHHEAIRAHCERCAAVVKEGE